MGAFEEGMFTTVVHVTSPDDYAEGEELQPAASTSVALPLQPRFVQRQHGDRTLTHAGEMKMR